MSRRVGPDNRQETDLIVEMTQNVDVRYDGRLLSAIQGCTVVINTRGQIRYVISKNAVDVVKQMRDRANSGEFDLPKFWSLEGGKWKEKPQLIAQVHAESHQD